MNARAKEKECAHLVKAAKVRRAQEDLTQSLSGWHWEDYDFRVWWQQQRIIDPYTNEVVTPPQLPLILKALIWTVATPFSFTFHHLKHPFSVVGAGLRLSWVTVMPIKTQHSQHASLPELWELHAKETRILDTDWLLDEWLRTLYGERGASINLQRLEDEFFDMEHKTNHDYYTGKSSTHVYFGNPTDYLIREVSEELGSY